MVGPAFFGCWACREGERGRRREGGGGREGGGREGQGNKREGEKERERGRGAKERGRKEEEREKGRRKRGMGPGRIHFNAAHTRSDLHPLHLHTPTLSP